MNHDDSVRLDIWLWAARFYKTRALAKSAIENGQVLVGKNRAKPARLIRVGDCLDIDKHGTQIFEVIVLRLDNKRVSASIAQTFYQETQESVAKRQALITQQKIAREMVEFPNRRPDKRERRKIRSFRHNLP